MNLVEKLTDSKGNTVDLTGRTIIVTGATSGVGFQAAKRLAAAHADLIITARSSEKGQRAKEEILDADPDASINLLELDLASFRSIQKFVEAFNKLDKPLHALINNAGVFLVDPDRTEDGFEITFGTNHFGPFYLTHLLMRKLRSSAPSRIVWVSSIAEQLAPNIDWLDLRGVKDTKSGLDMYSRTKLFNIMTSNELQARLAGSGVDSFACHPGVASTELYDKMDMDKISSKLMSVYERVIGQTPERGGIPLVYTATEPSLQGEGGTYYGPNVLNLFNTGRRNPVNRLASDKEACTRLYDLTKQIIEAQTGQTLIL